jgi:NAD(P)-dependent dehydrogenase (short-subunit alcohol dehydrogenase family)
MENRRSVIVVTGASSGIGNACATFMAKKGCKVYGTCRNPGSYTMAADEFFEMLPMDLSDDLSVAKAAERILAAEGRVDSLVCCAGSGLLGSIEDTGLDEAQALLNVNFFGTLRTIKAFLPKMREEGRGRIVVVGAIEGQASTPFQGIYSAAEHALEGLIDALRSEVADFGIEAGLIELGSFRTAFGQNRKLAKGAGAASPYKPSLESVSGILSRDEASGLEPLIAAKTIYGAITARHLPPRIACGSLARLLLLGARRWLPARAFERGLRAYYNFK